MSVYSSDEWVKYYEANNNNLKEIPWEDDYSLSESEFSSISDSIAEFQLGESSEGKHLFSVSKKYSEKNNEPNYLQATKLFIQEEQRHARDLLKFMKKRGIGSKQSAWPDKVFRSLRHLSGLETSICVLVIAEIIAQTYYPAFKKATKDPILIALCNQIIYDEKAHVEFQALRIANLRKNCNKLQIKLSLSLQKFLFSGTIFVVWFQHSKVFLKAGIKFSDYAKDCWHNYHNAELIMKKV